MKFVITYTKTLTFEETIEAATMQKAERHAESRAYGSCEIDDDFDTRGTFDTIEFAIEGPLMERGTLPEDMFAPVMGWDDPSPWEMSSPVGSFVEKGRKALL
ncbi:MAG: hypothetical protein H0U76_03925 [Ktedonobacteraceae bacterium]|nr:hypothetical protein [Ktedonobacteraceae bacterium]